MREMSEARSLIASLCVLSRTISAIWTAWAWWTIMSRAKPASAESSPGGLVTSRAAVAPAEQPARRTSTRMTTSQRRDEERSLRGVGSMRVVYYLPGQINGVQVPATGEGIVVRGAYPQTRFRTLNGNANFREFAFPEDGCLRPLLAAPILPSITVSG